MMASLGNRYGQEGIEELCETLEFMPLAIVQAGAYIKKRAPRCSALQYLDNFRKNDRKRTKLLKNEGQGLQRDEQASNSILITWQISFEHVREIRASAADLLSLMSFFDHQGIVESALRISSGAQKTDETSSRKRRRDSTDSDVQFEADYEFGEDIVILRDFSFISSTQVPHTFQMHALVQLATRSWLEDHNQISQWRNQFIENISYEFGGSDEEYARWQERQILFPHVKSALDHRPDSPQHLKTWASLMQRGAAHAVENSNHQDTLRMASKSLETMKSIFGAQHDNTLLSLNMMATALIIGGKFNDAQAMLETALADSDNDLACKEHVRTEIMYSLGLLYHLTDRQLEAEPLLKKAIEGTTNRSCPSERDTLTCMHTLANVYCRQGRYSEGEDLALRAMEGAIKNLGERDYTTLRSMSTLARFYFSQKRYQEAATLQRQALNSAESFFGKGNLRSHEFGHALARTYAKQGNFEEAERLYRSANDVFRAVLGDEHITAISSSAELAEFFIQRGRFIDALPILEEIVDICSRVIGRQHSSTIKYSSQLGFTYCILSRFGEAELVLKNTIEASERNFREDSHHDAREDMFSQELSLYTLASIYHIQGRLNEAEPIIAKLVKGATEQHGENASVTLRYVGQLAGNYKEQERWHEALSLQMKILNIRKEMLGEYHEDTSTAIEGLAETLELMGQTDDAMAMMNTITTLRSEAANANN
jgi:tetratricopeptide (TPR) repeat protein